MGKVILIVGSETLLGRKLIEKNLSAGNRVIAPVMSKDENTNEPQKNNLLVIPWNKSSIISTRTVIREGIRIFHKIDEAILVYSENKTNDQIEDFSTSEIDETVETSINGTIYIVRELLRYFQKQVSSSLSFALYRKSTKSPNSLESGYLGFFKYFGDSVISKEGKIYKCAFTSSVSEMDSYAAFIANTLNEKPPKANGQWLNYSEKKNIFSSLPIVNRRNEL